MHPSWLVILVVLPLLSTTLPLTAQAPGAQQALSGTQTREPPMPSKLAARRTTTVLLVERVKGAVVNIQPGERTVKNNSRPADAVFALAPVPQNPRQRAWAPASSSIRAATSSPTITSSKT